jgi:outer membrane protein insertion porin family
MKRFLLGLFFVVNAAWLMAADGFIISDVRVEGLQRVSAGSVFNTLGLRAGDTATPDGLAQASKALFKTGYFSDIKLSRDGEVLVVTVVEQPSVSSITIDGNKAIKTEDLMDGLKKAGLEDGQIFQQATLEGVTLELERQYVAQGKYNAKVKTDVEPQDNNRVALTIHITEGEEASILQVNIVGNTVYSDQELLEQFELRPPEMLAWYKSAMQYSKEKMNADLEKLRSYYLDNGYINFQIVSTQISITPDKKDIYVTINVSEGAQYTVSKVELSGTYVVPEKELRKRILVKEGEIFSRLKITKTADFISRRLGNEGYTFANVNPIPETNDEDHTVAINFFVDPGKRAYVREIDFHGNSKTEDEVFRREMRQFEGAWASTEKIDQSKERLSRLPYVKSVNVETKPVAGAEDQVDVSYTVEEQPSGSLSASVGFSQGSGLVLSTSVTQDNFLGTGKQMGVELSNSDSTTSLGFNYLDPYFTDDGISRGYNASYTTTKFANDNLANYTNDKIIAGVTFGYPFSEIDRLSFSLGVANNNLTVGNNPPIEITEYFDSEGSANNALTGGIAWNRSTLNSGTLATRGAKQSLTMQMALPGSDVTYYKTEYKGQKYRPITDDFTLRFKGSAAYSKAILSSKYVPFYDHYYAGGLGSIRGFDNNTIGPTDTLLRCLNPPGDPSGDGDCKDTGWPYGEREEMYDGDPFGGNARLLGSVELLFPVPFVEDQKAVQSYLFFDGGSVFNTEYTQQDLNQYAQKNLYINNAGDKEYSISMDHMRYSVGLGIDWTTPFGPISVSFAKPIQKSDTDQTQFFQFSLGKTF